MYDKSNVKKSYFYLTCIVKKSEVTKMTSRKIYVKVFLLSVTIVWYYLRVPLWTDFEGKLRHFKNGDGTTPGTKLRGLNFGPRSLCIFNENSGETPGTQ